MVFFEVVRDPGFCTTDNNVSTNKGHAHALTRPVTMICFNAGQDSTLDENESK